MLVSMRSAKGKMGRLRRRDGILRLAFVALVTVVVVSAVASRREAMRRVKVSEHWMGNVKREERDANRSDIERLSEAYEAWEEVAREREWEGKDRNKRRPAVKICRDRDPRFPRILVAVSEELYFTDIDVENNDKRSYDEWTLYKRSQKEGGSDEISSITDLSASGQTILHRYGGWQDFLALSIFEAELCSRSRCPGESVPGIAILGLLENPATQREGISRGRWMAQNSPLASKLNGLITCKFYSKGILQGESVALIESNAFKRYFLKLYCPIPRDALTEGRVLETSPRFEIVVDVKSESNREIALHGDNTLKICRMDASAMRAHERHGETAICLRPLSLFQIASPIKSVEISHLSAWLDFHLHVVHVDHIYLLDRWNELEEDLHHYVQSGRVSLIPFPYFSEMQTNKEISSDEFLSTYDQGIAYETCLMRARQNGEKWLVNLDSDEWLRTMRNGTASVFESLEAYVEKEGKSYEGIHEVKIHRFDMFRQQSDDGVSDSDANLWPVEAYTLRATSSQKKSRSTLNPYNVAVMTPHNAMAMKPGDLDIPTAFVGNGETLGERENQFICIYHYTCSQAAPWPQAMARCPCPEKETCIYDLSFQDVRARIDGASP